MSSQEINKILADLLKGLKSIGESELKQEYFKEVSLQVRKALKGVMKSVKEDFTIEEYSLSHQN